ncbi:hypothetical protein Gpo141_00014676, partial [Globisporangium polare]
MRHHDQRAPAAASRVQAQARPLFYETRVTPVAAVADALETDIHVLTLNDFLAEQPFNWELPAAAAVLKQCPPFQICPESPCSVALETAPDGVPASCGPLQSVGIEPFDVSTCADDALLYSWLFLHETGGDVGRAREYPQQQEQLPPLQATRAPQTYPQPHSLNGDFSSQDVGKERLRKRQRMYEQKYRKKKRTNFKQMRREWLFLETMLLSHQAQRAQGIPQATSRTQQQQQQPRVRLQAQVVQLHLEEQAIGRDNLLLDTAVKWQKFFELQVQEPEADADTEPK